MDCSPSGIPAAILFPLFLPPGRRMRWRCFPVVLFTLTLSACGGNETATPPPPINVADSLKELGEVYKYIAAQKLATPRKVEDFAEYDGSLVGALPKLRSGEIVVVWGAGYSSGSTQILAYGKDTASNGGPVLLRNGTVKEMTAAEFSSAKGR